MFICDSSCISFVCPIEFCVRVIQDNMNVFYFLRSNKSVHMWLKLYLFLFVCHIEFCVRRVQDNEELYPLLPSSHSFIPFV